MEYKEKGVSKKYKDSPNSKFFLNGQIETNPDTLKKLYAETYQHRLIHRPIRGDLVYLKSLKENLFELRLELVKLVKSKPWTRKQLKTVLSALKTNKSRDPHGLIRDIFRPGVIGSDLESSLLTLMNKIRENCLMPEFIQWANITSLYKSKGTDWTCQMKEEFSLLACSGVS